MNKMKKTIGKNTLGDNDKMSVNLKNYSRSTHNLSFKILNTQAPGTLVPLYKRLVLPGDTIELDTDVSILTHPTVGPLFGSFKFQMDYFFCPMRLYNSWLHNNRLNIGMDMSQIKIPTIRISGDSTEFSHSSLVSYLGIKGIGTFEGTSTTGSRTFNGVPFLAYWDIYKNYYANTQQTAGYYITDNATITSLRINNEELRIGSYGDVAPRLKLSTGDIISWQPAAASASTVSITLEDGTKTTIDTLGNNEITINGRRRLTVTVSGNGKTIANVGTPAVVVGSFELTNIDKMRDEILSSAGNVTFKVQDRDYQPYASVNYSAGGVSLNTKRQRLLALKTYNSDLFNNWIKTSWITGENGINAITAIDTSSGSFTMDTLNLSKKVYDMLNRIAVSGGTYNDWIETVYTTNYFQRSEIPVFIGGMSSEIVFQEVISNASVEGEPLGTLAGKGRNQGKKGGHIKFKTDEPGYILGISSITPRIVYSQGNDWDMYAIKTLNDLHKPALDGIGYQDLITEQMHYAATNIDSTTGVITQTSAGKQPAWINYMTDINVVRGNFAIPTEQGYMTMKRDYDYLLSSGGIGIKDLTTYIDPAKYNHVFANTRRDAQNFWAQIKIDVTARRKMSAKLMPNL